MAQSACTLGAAVAVVLAAMPGAAENVRFVPQLGLTNLDPIKVAFDPTDGTRVLVVDQSGRIDLFDVTDPRRPLKTLEIQAGANDAAFHPDGDRLGSAGADGTVRLWHLDGTPAAKPFVGHRGQVRSIAFGPSGDRVVSGGTDGTVRFWRLDGTPLTEPSEDGHAGWVMSVAFAGDGKHVASGGLDGTVRLWTADGLAAAPPFRGHEGPVWSVAMDRTGSRIVSGGADGSVRLWRLDGSPIGEPFRGHVLGVRSVAFDPTGGRIVSADTYGHLQFWRLDGTPAERLQTRARSVAFHPAGDLVVSAGLDGAVRFWNGQGVPEGIPFRTSARVASFAFSPAGELIASGSHDGTIRLWRLDGSPVGEAFRTPDGAVTSLAFDPAGESVASGSSDGTIRLSGIDGRSVGEPFRGHDGAVASVAFDPAGELVVSGGSDGTIRLWRRDGSPVGGPFRGHDGAVASVAFDPAGELVVSGGSDGTIRLWRRDGSPVGEPFRGHRTHVNSVAFDPKGERIVSGGRDSTVRVWHLDGSPIGEPSEHPAGEVNGVAFDPAGENVVSGGNDDTIRIWRADGRPVGTPLLGHSTELLGVAFDRAGDRIVSADKDGTVRVWRLAVVEVGQPLRGRRHAMTAPIAFDPATESIVAGDRDGPMRVVPLDGTPETASFPLQEGDFGSVAFDRMGERLAWTSGPAIHLGRRDGMPIGEPLRGHDRAASSVAFDPAGERLVSGGADGTIHLWGVDGRAVGEPFRGHDGPVTGVAFDPRGERIASGGQDGTVRLWHLDGRAIGEPLHYETTITDGTATETVVYPIASVAFDATGERVLFTDGGEWGRAAVVWDVADGTHRVFRRCRLPHIERIRADRFALICADRIVVFDSSLREVGTLFPHPDGPVVMTASGLLAPSSAVNHLIVALAEDGGRQTGFGAVPSLTQERLRQILFGEYTLVAGVRQLFVDAYGRVRTFYGGLGWLRAPFWPVLAWTLVVLSAGLVWLVAPARLAAAAMPVAGTAPAPPWKWLLGVLAVYGWLGQTRRPVRAWLRRHRRELEAAFAERRPVRERARYAPLGHDHAMDTLADDLIRRAVAWIDGVGGSGKSALAFQFAHKHLIGRRGAPLPVLVDADWDGPLAAEVARQLHPPDADRGPTVSITRTLGALGLVCPIVDSLSERRSAGAVALVGRAVQEGDFRHLIVTSRAAPPAGGVWDRCRRISPAPIAPGDVPLFVATYAPETPGVVAARIAPLVAEEPLPSPLFLRFAIEQATQGPLASTDKVDLVLHYVEALRHERIGLSRSDMLRGASVAALEATRESGVPREIERLHLRGVLRAEADRMPFMDAANTAEVTPASLIDRLIEAGLVNEIRSGDRLQFAYDPVAEYLAARWLAAHDDLEPLRRRLFAAPTPLAAAHREITAAVAAAVK